MNKTVKAYVNRILASAQKRGAHGHGLSKEGMCGYLENVLFQLKRKEEKQKAKLTITAEEIAEITKLLAKAEAEWALEEQLQSTKPGVNEKCK